MRTIPGESEQNEFERYMEEAIADLEDQLQDGIIGWSEFNEMLEELNKEEEEFKRK